MVVADVYLTDAGECVVGRKNEGWLAAIGTAALNDFVRVAEIVGYELDVDQLIVEASPAPHKRSALPARRMAIYSFWHGKKALKIGLASPNNDARFRYHHYSPGTCVSNLSLSIRDHYAELGLLAPPERYRTWIEAEIGRIDFLLPAEWGQPIGRLLESYLHARWRPRFEGRAWMGYGEALAAPIFDLANQ